MYVSLQDMLIMLDDENSIRFVNVLLQQQQLPRKVTENLLWI